MSGRYASTTTVSAENSRAEIERTLRRYGADAFMYASDGNRAVVGFRIHGRQIRFVTTMPDPKADEFNIYYQGKTKYARADGVPQKLWEQARRSSWRALALVIKAKLEAVAAGITTIEDEFLAHTVLPDGSTVGDWAKPQLAIAYERGTMPTTLLIAGPDQ